MIKWNWQNYSINDYFTHNILSGCDVWYILEPPSLPTKVYIFGIGLQAYAHENIWKKNLH